MIRLKSVALKCHPAHRFSRGREKVRYRNLIGNRPLPGQRQPSRPAAYAIPIFQRFPHPRFTMPSDRSLTRAVGVRDQTIGGEYARAGYRPGTTSGSCRMDVEKIRVCRDAAVRASGHQPRGQRVDHPPGEQQALAGYAPRLRSQSDDQHRIETAAGSRGNR